MCVFLFFFFFQAEDGIRDYKVTGVQTCALPISAPGCSRRALAAFAALALSGSMYAVAQVPQAPKPATPDVKRGEPAPPPRSADGRYGIQVLVATVNVYADASPRSAVLAQLQQGARLEADQRRGNWYRIHLA